MSKSKSNYIFIVFQRIKALEILRYTNLQLIQAGDIWIEAYASEADIETFKLNGWNYWTK